MPAPTLDGFATGTHSGAGAMTATLTTTQANDIIVAVAHYELNTNQPWGTSVSGGGLTWQLRSRASNAFGANFRQTIEIWWAVAASALAAQVISVTSNITYDDAAMVVFGVHGCNTANPWDANPSLPAQNTVASPPSVGPITTTNANDFQIFAVGNLVGTGPGTTPPAGFTMIGNADNGGGTNYSHVSVAYQGVMTQQSGQIITWGSSPGSAITLFDVLTADAGGVNALPGVAVEYVATIAGSGTSLALPVCAPSAGDTLLVAAYNWAGPPAQVVSGVSGGGLTWTQRFRSHGSSAGSLEVWTAPAAASLATATVTVSYPASPAGVHVVALALTGAAAGMFDSNASLPAHASDTTGAGTWTPSVGPVSTSQAHAAVLAMTGGSGSNNNLTSVPAGFQLLTATAALAIGLQGRNAALSNATIAWAAAITGEATGTGAAGEYIVDALTADAVVAGGAQARVMVLA